LHGGAYFEFGRGIHGHQQGSVIQGVPADPAGGAGVIYPEEDGMKALDLINGLDTDFLEEEQRRIAPEARRNKPQKDSKFTQ
jgi:hypothetical protein